MAKKTIIRLTEADIHQMVKESVNNLLREWDNEDWDEYDDFEGDSDANEDFNEYEFDKKLMSIFPEKEFECECDDNGEVTIIELGNGYVYHGEAELKSDVGCANYPSATDSYSQAEETYYYYDFDPVFEEICEKIKTNTPDDINDEYIYDEE